MEQVCPVCNGLIRIHEFCRKCGLEMDEKGKMEDYLGPYTPYMDDKYFVYDNRGLVMGDNLCVHLFHCKNCDKVQYRAVPSKFF